MDPLNSAGRIAGRSVRPKRVLMIAFHFPPLRGSSGIQRTLRFVQHLPKYGWESLVLSAHPRAYDDTSVDQLGEIPAATVVRRATAFNAARHFSLSGRYPNWLALPDRWSSWILGAVPAGLAMIHKYRPDLIWSTYPIASAHVIGGHLARISGLPWIADFRDPMAQVGYPSEAAQWRAFKRIEERALHRADRSVFTTPGAARFYAKRYPEVEATRIAVIENGYDEETFARVEEGFRKTPRHGRKVVLLHSGIIYPSERDPRALFSALAALKARGALNSENFVLRLRASGYDAMWAAQAHELGISDLIEISAPLGYREALLEMLDTDSLLVLQASNCNEQIPAKLYEYLRAGRPILALTDPEGDTAAVLRSAGLTSMARLDDQHAIETTLVAFLERVRNDSEPKAEPTVVASSSREGRAAQLARVMDATLAARSGAL